MLILTHTDGFRINLDKLRQRILQSSCDGSRTPLTHVKIGEFLGSQLAGRIHRGTRLIYDHILNRCIQLLNQFNDHLLRLTGSCSVAHADQRNMIFADQPL